MERTQHQPSTEAPPPTGNKILDEPATVDACRADYDAGAAQRADSTKRDAKARQ